jgi:hypothetical protein
MSLPGPDTQTLAALVFELASQLHVERSRRMSLEAALAEAGVLPQGAVEAAGQAPAARKAALAAADRSTLKFMRVLTEGADPRTPLRAKPE